MTDASDGEARLEALVEDLAAIEHERWAHWQRYMHDKGERQPDGSLVIPADLEARWEAQIATAYADLTPAEQKSDRDQVRRYLPLIRSVLDAPDRS